jgi:hypothetical protein
MSVTKLKEQIRRDILAYLERTKISKRQFAIKMQIDPGNFCNYLLKKRSIPDAKLDAIIKEITKKRKL